MFQLVAGLVYSLAKKRAKREVKERKKQKLEMRELETAKIEAMKSKKPPVTSDGEVAVCPRLHGLVCNDDSLLRRQLHFIIGG